MVRGCSALERPSLLERAHHEVRLPLPRRAEGRLVAHLVSIGVAAVSIAAAALSSEQKVVSVVTLAILTGKCSHSRSEHSHSRSEQKAVSSER